MVARASLQAAPPAMSARLTNYYQPAEDGPAERVLILKVLEESGGNKAKAARRLGMSRTTLWKRLSQAG
jgi:two-component system, NtrC family, response regulator HydG